MQHLQAKDANYDIVTVDVVWTAEFAAKGWLEPLTGALRDRHSKAAQTDGRLRHLQRDPLRGPRRSDGGISTTARTSCPTPPTTWDEMLADCQIAKENGIDCYAGQFAQYEGLP